MGRRRKQLDIEADAPKLGHNSNLTGDERLALSGFVSEIEKLDAEIKTLNQDKSEILKSAKDRGFDTAAIRHVIKVRRMERAERDAWQNAVDAYTHALGMLAGTPLGQAAVQRDLPQENQTAA